MAIEGKEFVSYIRKSLKNSITVGFELACDHPLMLGNVVFLLILYKSCPFLFAFLVSSSPVIICTALLLGFILSYGEPNFPEIEEDEKNQEISSLQVGSAANDLVVEKDESKRENTERMVKVAEEKVADEIGVYSEAVIHERKSSVEKQAEGPLKMVENVCASSTSSQMELKGLKAGTLEDHFDSSLGSTWQPIDNCSVSSDSDTDSSESSSPDASMSEIIPMLDELHPLLVNDHPTIKSVDNSDAASSVSSQDHESDDGSAMEEQQDDEEDGEAQEDKDDGNEAAVKWTADDQKNLMDLGTSEIERNQRLENLIAKRKARNNLRYESNLIDLDINYQVPAISATRRNPFDLPDGSEANIGLPPIPGSAPSILAPRRNPFDITYDQVDESGSLAMENSSSQEFVSFSQRDVSFRRHESFSLGAPFYDSRFKPIFVADRATGAGSSSFQRELNEMSDSKVTSVPESGTVSSVMDHDHHKRLLDGLHHESKLLSAAYHDTEPVDSQSQSSDSAESVNPNHELTNVGDDHAIDLNTSIVTDETHQAADAFQAVEIRELGYDSPISDDATLEVIEDKYDESSSSSSSEMNGENSKMGKHEESVNLEKSTGEPKHYGDSMHLLSADSKFLSGDGERVDDSQVSDPVYDSSPSALEKSVGEDLFDTGNRDLNSSSLASIMADISEAGSPPRPPVKKTTSRGDFETGMVWVASPHLSFVDQNESRSREINEIRERDVIKVALLEVAEDFAKPVAFVMPRAADGRIVHSSSLSLLGTNSSDHSLQHKEGTEDASFFSSVLSIDDRRSLTGLRLTEPEEPIEDADSHPEQLRDVGPNKDISSEAEPSEHVEATGYHLDVMGAHTDPRIVDGNALKGMSLASAENLVKPMELKDGSGVVGETSGHQEPEGFDVQSLVKEEQTLGFENSSTVASTSKKVGKKDEGGKSSSSSSSSSSSDSD